MANYCHLSYEDRKNIEESYDYEEYEIIKPKNKDDLVI